MLKPHEVSGRLQAIAALVGKCPQEECGQLVQMLRDHLKALGFKQKEIEQFLGRYPELRAPTAA